MTIDKYTRFFLELEYLLLLAITVVNYINATLHRWINQIDVCWVLTLDVNDSILQLTTEINNRWQLAWTCNIVEKSQINMTCNLGGI